MEESDDGECGNGVGSEEFAKTSEQLSKGLKSSKLGNLKGKNLAKSKKLSKSRNSPNFDVKKAGPSFLTPKAKAVFNRLRKPSLKPQFFNILIRNVIFGSKLMY